MRTKIIHQTLLGKPLHKRIARVRVRLVGMFLRTRPINAYCGVHTAVQYLLCVLSKIIASEPRVVLPQGKCHKKNEVKQNPG